MKRMFTCDELQNENLYLYAPDDSRVVKEILEEQRKYKWGYSRREKFFKETYEDYDKFITLIAKFFKELKLDNNAITLSVILRKLILDGYFSKDNIFTADKSGMFYDVPLLEGMDIIDGKGCCRHLANFYSSIFKKLDMFDFSFSCYYAPDDYLDDIAFLQLCNHVAPLIKHNNVIYCYDCYTNMLLKSVNGFTMEQILRDTDNHTRDRFFYKPSACVMGGSISYKEALDMINVLKENSKKETITYDDFINIRSDCLRIFNSNTELFGDLKSDAKKYTKKLAKDLRNAEIEFIDSLY